MHLYTVNLSKLHIIHNISRLQNLCFSRTLPSYIPQYRWVSRQVGAAAVLLLLHVFLPRICHAQDFHGRQYFFLNYIQDVDCLNMMFIMGEKRELRTCQVRYTTTFSYILSRISLYYLLTTSTCSNGMYCLNQRLEQPA